MEPRRLIPVLGIDRSQRVVKTVAFGARTYVGDPFNIVRLFNEKEVDELVILDIDASVDARPPDLGFIRELVSEAFMPVGYGGGLRDLSVCERLARVGVEKQIIGSGAVDASFLRALVSQLGSQSVVGCVDVLGHGAGAPAVVMSGTRSIGSVGAAHARYLQDVGCGEVVLQSVLRDGARRGYDLELIRSVASSLSVPLIALGGAGSVEDFPPAFEAGAAACASGSAFTFFGARRAVLVTYPTSRAD
jgi:cyclase